MALWYCRGCTAAYAVGLKACPECGANDPSRQPVGRQESTTDPPGPAENLTTGQVTPAGQPLPEVPAEAYAPGATELDPPRTRKARSARKATDHG